MVSFKIRQTIKTIKQTVRTLLDLQRQPYEHFEFTSEPQSVDVWDKK